MTHEEKGIFADLMALAWDSEEPGTISLDFPSICRELRVYSTTLRKFLRKFPTTWQKVNSTLVQPKLRLQWLKYQEISEKRKQAASKCSANAQQVGGSAFAVAPAFASAKSKDTPPTPPQAGGTNHLEPREWNCPGGTLVVWIEKGRRGPFTQSFMASVSGMFFLDRKAKLEAMGYKVEYKEVAKAVGG